MAQRPLEICSEPGCYTLSRGARCDAHKYVRNKPTVSWYNHKRWKLKRQRLLATNPICVECEKQGKTVAATEVDHVQPHRGDKHKFWYGKLQALCRSCHTQKTFHGE